MRIIAMVVAQNEADRYWGAFLEWTQTFADEVVVYDDQSTDGTAEIALQKGCLTAVRFDDDPSFLENESHFRANAWRWMETVAAPTENDWILALDADEFLVDPRGERNGLLIDAALIALNGGNAASFHIPEIFGSCDDGLLYRTDGWWNTIYRDSYMRYSADVTFGDRALGCGSLPSPRVSQQVTQPQILHFGYKHLGDRLAKYHRYTAHAGHGSSHVESILKKPTLELWTGPEPFRTSPEHQSQIPA